MKKVSDVSEYKYKPILLYYATFHQDIETVKFLVENGVDVNEIFIPDNDFLGCTEGDSQNCFPYYRPMPALQAAFYNYLRSRRENSNLEIIKILIQAGADVNWEKEREGGYYDENDYRSKKIPQVLYQACREFDDTEILKLLLKAGAKPNHSCLEIAIKNENIETVKFLIKYGLNLNYQSESVQTALKVASQTTNDIKKITKITDILLEDTVYDNCDSFLHLAVRTKNIKIVKLLIEAGADVNLKNRYGKTPLDNAMNLLLGSIEKHNMYGYSEKEIWEEIIELFN